MQSSLGKSSQMSNLAMVTPTSMEVTEAYEKALKEALKPIVEMGFYAAIFYQDIQHLEGKILTIVDASFTDREQRKAVKDLIRRSFWFDWANSLEGKCENSAPNGMPNLE